MMKKLIITVLATLMIVPAFAQTRKLTGTVRDENSEVLAGAIVLVKSGKADGPVTASATTDANGRYTVECKESDYISVHFLGYDDAVFPVKGKKSIDVVLEQDAESRLNDAVVIGYGSVRKADLTGSVANVKMADIRDEPVLSVDQALQGRIAGVEITSTDGEPG